VSAAASSADVTALQTTLAAEQAAVYGYGVVGAHVTGAARAEALRAMTWHQTQQPLLSALLAAAAAKPVAADPAYVLPFRVTDAVTAVRLAERLEDAVAAAYADLVAQSSGADRLSAAQALMACAVQAVSWSGLSQAFPGLPERATGR
jgi:hypothetical protein